MRSFSAAALVFRAPTLGRGLPLVLTILMLAPRSVGAGWAFPVTPEAQPALVVELTRFLHEEFAPCISLRHELVFDGCDFRSRIIIPELYSYLVSGARGEYRWRPPGKSEVTLKRASVGQNWEVRPIGTFRFCVASSDGGTVLTYEHCQLVSIIVGGREYHFDYSHQQLRSIMRTKPSAEELVSLGYNAFGDLEHVRVGTQLFTVSFNQDGQMTSCRIAGAALPILVAQYTDGMLTRAEIGSMSRTFIWGSAADDEYIQPPLPLPPVVVDDGLFTYYSTRMARIITIHFKATDATTEGYWQLNTETGRVGVSYKRR